MKFSKRTKYMLFGSLIFIAISLRYPFTPHEIGWDSYFIHGLINSLNHQGNLSSWWVHPLSPFGFTPFSYASAVPILVSAFSQMSGLSIESSIWLFGILYGILGVFGSYLVAKEVFNDDNYIFLVVFGFTTSEVFLGYTTWTITTRGTFITILPFFLFLLLRNAKSKKFNKFTFLAILVFVLLVAIHHLYTFLILPIILYALIKHINISKKIEKNKSSRKIINIICGIFLFIIILLIMLDIITSKSLTGISKGTYESKIDLIINTIKIYARQMGILGIFGIIGFFYLLYKPEKNLNQILLIFFILVLLPFIFITVYLPAFIAIFVYLLGGFGIFYIGKYIYFKKDKKIALIVIILILSISFTFSSIYRVRYPDIEAETKYDEIFMEEDNYDAGLWLKYTINDSVIYSNNIYPLKRIAGVMNLKQFPGSPIEQLENGYISLEDYEMKFLSPLDPYFWSESFYMTEPHQQRLNWKTEWLKKENYNSKYSKNFLYIYNIKYVIEDKQVLLHEKNENKIFFTSLNEECFKTYSNQEYNIFYIH